MRKVNYDLEGPPKEGWQMEFATVDGQNPARPKIRNIP